MQQLTPSVHGLQVSSAKVQLSSRVSRLFRTCALSCDKVGRIANVLDSRQDILERDGLVLLAPAKRSRKALVLYGTTH